MSRNDQITGDRAALTKKQIEHWRKTHRPSPCGNAPSTPTNLTSSFDRSEGGKGAHRIRLVGKWDEVATDTEGLSDRIRFYKVHGEYSADTTNIGVTPGTENGTWFPAFRRTIPGKEDADANSMVRFVEKGIKAKLAYRWYVIAIDTNGCRSARAWITPGFLNGETPPAPTDVRIHKRAHDRVHVHWHDTPDPTDPDRRRDDQSWFLVQYANDSAFNNMYERHHKIQHHSDELKVPKADRDLTFYARVFAVNDHGDKDVRSLPIPAKYPPGNSDPFANPDPAVMGGHVIATFHGSGVIAVGWYEELWTADQDYGLRRVNVRFGRHDSSTHPNDGPPIGSDAIIQVFWHNEDESQNQKLFSLDNRLTVHSGQHRDQVWYDDLNVKEVKEGEHLSVKVVQVGSTYAGRAMVVQIVGIPES